MEEFNSTNEPQLEAQKPVVTPEAFDWDTYEKGDSIDTNRQRDTELYDKTLSQIQNQEVVEGTVVSINKREVVVNIGYKSDGVIPYAEFRYNPDLKVGDKVEVFIENQEDKKGQLILSHRLARHARSWDRVKAALESQEIIHGYIKSRTKGGMIVEVFGIEAFLPGSQIDVKPIRDYDVFVDKTMEFKIVKINDEYKNIVVSHKALIEEELEEQRKEIISRLEKGQVLEGIVKNITSYGVFIDLGGVDGLIHITDLSWGRINHPNEIVQLDQKINVVILDFDEEKKRIALGLKQLTPHPWDALDQNLKVGDKVKGKVVVMADYGAFLEIIPGVEGLIHVSEMSWSQHLRSANDFLKVGDEVEAVILTAVSCAPTVGGSNGGSSGGFIDEPYADFSTVHVQVTDSIGGTFVSGTTLKVYKSGTTEQIGTYTVTDGKVKLENLATEARYDFELIGIQGEWAGSRLENYKLPPRAEQTLSLIQPVNKRNVLLVVGSMISFLILT